MKRFGLAFFPVFAAFLAWLASPATLPAATPGGAVTGNEAPAFTLVDSDGKTHSLSDFAGKTVVLEWTNKDCPFVRKFYDTHSMQQWQETYTADGETVWLTICSSAPGKQGHMSASDWTAYRQEQGMRSTAILIDEDGAVGKAYGAKTTPHMYIIDPEGTLRYQGAIDSIRSTKAEDIGEATNYVAEALASLKAGTDIAETDTQPYGCSVKY